MAQFIHVVGPHGAGKSQLIRALARDYVARGIVVAGDDPEVFSNRYDAVRRRPGAQVYFIEHLDADALDAQPGELVIRLERAPVPQAAVVA